MMWRSDIWAILWMPLVWLAFAGLVVWLVFVLVRPTTPRPGARAREILEERYARGEIDRDEFLAMRQELLQ
jgi:putative membrane protein